MTVWRYTGWSQSPLMVSLPATGFTTWLKRWRMFKQWRIPPRRLFTCSRISVSYPHSVELKDALTSSYFYRTVYEVYNLGKSFHIKTRRKFFRHNRSIDGCVWSGNTSHHQLNLPRGQHALCWVDAAWEILPLRRQVPALFQKPRGESLAAEDCSRVTCGEAWCWKGMVIKFELLRYICILELGHMF